MSMQSAKSFSTQAIHYGYHPQEHLGALSPPVYMSSTFTFPSAEYGGACFAGTEKGYFYSRISNPTLDLLERRIAILEEGEAAVAFSSGMGAITACCWTFLKPGDEVIVDQTIYGCTYAYFHHGLARFGVKITHVDLTDSRKLAAAISEQTRLVYCETPANPNMRIVDIAALSQITRANGSLFIVDNTYCTPYLQTPLALGADIVVHSATKYLGGHGDLLAGLAVTRKNLADQIRLVGLKDMNGAVLSAQDAALILRGMKTLAVRMERHCASAQTIAEKLSQHPLVEQIYYPGLPNFPQHELVKRQMRGAGGMIAFELRGGMAAGIAFLNALQLIYRAVSLGDCETLAQHPASMTHSSYTPEERRHHLISDGLIRLSVGLEDVGDLLNDLLQALEVAKAIHGNAELIAD
ncbi:methionine gamma-lyase [Yersinia kristensenii]|uniref:L-methionine gamma-lyase n=1 Tax=Yersinia kristensenii TaxID=28152 RepID=A0AB73P376_YERKR|nr:methionine gamma-lyase [Yersinia kristensenii]MDA5473406.1 methionine gamma-lyase [Yersinia kristensenii]MDA5477359.1 methionine gamma-lyase [Yersinia kristensenii]MDA5506411.1 methionine gamma-lyase [Yersinia kristensenii]MDA5521940.1 methionine gamma-lyase [Yersinia kristensenii]MDR4898721.1 methionine gamma-lyase [Yersinia kristensenii]